MRVRSRYYSQEGALIDSRSYETESYNNIEEVFEAIKAEFPFLKVNQQGDREKGVITFSMPEGRVLILVEYDGNPA